MFIQVDNEIYTGWFRRLYRLVLKFIQGDSEFSMWLKLIRMFSKVIKVDTEDYPVRYW